MLGAKAGDRAASVCFSVSHWPPRGQSGQVQYRPRRQLVTPHSLPWKGRKQAARGFLPLATTSNLALFLVAARG